MKQFLHFTNSLCFWKDNWVVCPWDDLITAAMSCLQVLKSDVEAALQVLNFAIYHKELTEMEEREQREAEMKQQADHDADATGGTVDGHGRWF
jgi:hypothetical protein